MMQIQAWEYAKREPQFSCVGKNRYGETKALDVAGQMSAKKGTQFDAYRCEHCGGWHVGHRSKIGVTVTFT